MSTLHRTSAIALIVMFLVAGCQSTDGAPPSETSAEPPPSETSAEPPTSEDLEALPEFVPERIEGGSARENQPHIDWVIETARAESGTRVPGLEAVSILEASGYPRSAMELTPDSSLIELPADSTSLAIRFEGECVVAQWGSDWYASAVEPVLVGDKCLLGETVSLD
jgi:hypothetical protein